MIKNLTKASYCNSLVILACLTACYRIIDPPKDWRQILALKSLKEIISAQEYYRRMALGENGQLEYWRRDIAGLHFVPYNGDAIRLISISIGLADKSPTLIPPSMSKDAKPQGGYWFEALPFEGEAKRKGSIFAVQATPDVSSPKGSITFIADQGHIYKKDMQSIPVKMFPVDPIQDGWTLVR